MGKDQLQQMLEDSQEREARILESIKNINAQRAKWQKAKTDALVTLKEAEEMLPHLQRQLIELSYKRGRLDGQVEQAHRQLNPQTA